MTGRWSIPLALLGGMTLAAIFVALIAGIVGFPGVAEGAPTGKNRISRTVYPPLIREAGRDTLNVSTGASIVGLWLDSWSPTEITTVYRWRVECYGFSVVTAIGHPPGVLVTLSKTTGHGVPGAWTTHESTVAGADTMDSFLVTRWAKSLSGMWAGAIYSEWSTVQFDTIWFQAVGADTSTLRWQVVVEGR
jgi:hypothetical protein